MNYPKAKELPTELTLSDYLEEIGDWVFQGRKTLQKVKLGNNTICIGKEAFDGCTSLKEVILTENLKEIKNRAFSSCSNLATINFPKNLELIGDEAFYENSNLTTVELPDKILQLNSYVFYNCQCLTNVILPCKIISIGNYAFYNCNITSITFPETLEEIGANAFQNNKLEKITLPTYIKDIKSYTFAYNKLSEIIIPEGVLSIGNESFADNPLKNIHISASVRSISDRAFGAFYLTDLKEIHFHGTTPPQIDNKLRSETLTLYVPAGFRQKYIDHNIWGQYTIAEESGINQLSQKIQIYSLTPGDVAILLDGKSATNLIINGAINGSDIKVIRSMTTLKELDLSNANITEGGDAYAEELNTANNTLSKNMFSSLTELTNIKLPKAVTSIATSAFNNCNKLAYIQIYNITPISIDTETFKDINKETCQLVIPILGKIAYSTAIGWKDFATVYVSAYSEDNGLLTSELSEEEAPNIKGLILYGTVGPADLPILQKLEKAEYLDMSETKLVNIPYSIGNASDDRSYE